ncbi:MAG: tRNA (adenosine(37)-N6)-threonylcarbamoyltransferase complex dimerization subunit type 1 TsaB [Gammaproteobacteria bacterium]|nr:tRNA (adenosine(37)-N6)-threonylcarbamoyltransferase complex dimerization subunit type 1 TsaB [Gammaproteobacteria bacterium]
MNPPNPEINILAVDTVTRHCSVAVSRNGSICRKSRTSLKHSSDLIGLIDHALKEQELTLPELDLVVVDTGPGSFTGVRTGIGVVQGIAYGAGIPACGIDSLSILAVASGADGIVLPVIDARMNQVYAGLYSVGGECQELVSPYVCDPEGIRYPDKGKLTVVGDGWQAWRSTIEAALEQEAVFDEAVACPDAGSAIEAVARYGLGTTGNPLALTATYVRDDVVRKPALR